jgi:hypothetical protein
MCTRVLPLVRRKDSPEMGISGMVYRHHNMCWYSSVVPRESSALYSAFYDEGGGTWGDVILCPIPSN